MTSEKISKNDKIAVNKKESPFFKKILNKILGPIRFF